MSALIVRFISDTSGDEGLRDLVESQDLGVPVDTFIDSELREWLSEMLPEETAAVVLCGLNRALGGINQITVDWNASEETTDEEYASFKDRLQGVLVVIRGLATDTIVEDARYRYEESVSRWIAAIDDYVRGRIGSANDHLAASNSFSSGAYEFYSSAWDEYVVTSCAIIEQ